jgi:hypothetical protein
VTGTKRSLRATTGRRQTSADEQPNKFAKAASGIRVRPLPLKVDLRNARTNFECDGDYFDITCSSFQDGLLVETIGRSADCSNRLTMQTKGPKMGPFLIILQSISVEQLFEKRFLALGMAVLMAMTIWLSVAGIVALIILRL